MEVSSGCLTRLPSAAALLHNLEPGDEVRLAHQASANMSQSSPPKPAEVPKLGALVRSLTRRYGRSTREADSGPRPAGIKLTVAEHRPQGIFGVPLRQSITYANVAISLVDEDGKSYIYGYVPIVVAKCGVFLKERGT